MGKIIVSVLVDMHHKNIDTHGPSFEERTQKLLIHIIW